ncbi:M48 family metalloprotease [Patulibacter brassicae]|uniref:M48 family metalloprotease n=1 Tax=Patulibacter brassicae TaxID=1705717 RepID=A0ABU4VQL9_9ACTN|nr:M48 family metalloprotease [Patulibacter brassicae]MDX8153394.1 M48 family metalloprotease [Patulibacter brassicae]
MTALPAALGVVLMALPHMVRRGCWSPSTSLLLWVVALGVRAGGCLLVALWLMIRLPSTTVFTAVTDWCVDTAVPVLAAHVGVLGPEVGDALSLLPFVALNLSALWGAVRVARGAREVRQMVSQSTVGVGPRGAVILGGREVMLGAAGFLRPRVVVSAGALVALDDAELAAAIAHERAHIRRGHRFIAAFAELCGTIARPVPGTRAIVAEVHKQIERDADAWAVRRDHDRVALASAICKSALSRAGGPALALLSGAGVAQRVEELLGGGPVRASVGEKLLLAVAIVGASGFLVAAVGWILVTLASGSAGDPGGALRHVCPPCGL